MDIKYNVVIPEMPKMIDKEQFFVYTPGSLTLTQSEGSDTLVSKDSSNIMKGRYGLVIGSNNESENQGLIIGFNNTVKGEISTINEIFGDNNSVVDSKNTFVFGKDIEINNVPNSFVGGQFINFENKHNNWDNSFIYGKGKVTYEDGRTEQFYLKNIHHGMYVGPYHSADTSYADSVSGSVNTMIKTKHCLVGGYKNTVKNAAWNTVSGGVNIVEQVTGSGDYSMYGNALFGQNNKFYDVSNSFGVGYMNTVREAYDSVIFGSSLEASKLGSTLVQGYHSSVNNIEHSAVVCVNSNIGESGRNCQYNAIFGGYHTLNDIGGNLIAGTEHETNASDYQNDSTGNPLNVGHNLIIGQKHYVKGVWRSIIAGGPDQNGNNNYVEDCWNSVISGSDLRTYFANDSAVFGLHHKVGSYSENGTNTGIVDDNVIGSLISGSSHKVKKSRYSVFTGYSNQSIMVNNSIIGGAYNSVDYMENGIVVGRGNIIQAIGATVIPYGSAIFGINCIIQNTSCTATVGHNHEIDDTYGSLISGGNNLVTNSDYCSLSGSENYANNSYYCSLSGRRNRVSNANNSLVSGNNNMVSGDNNLVSGEIHEVSGNNNIIGGASQDTYGVSGNGNVVGGFRNRVPGNYNAVFGEKMEVSGHNNVVGGASCNVAAIRSLTIGFGLINRCNDSVVFGKFAAAHVNSANNRFLFSIGDGKSSTDRKDAVTLYTQINDDGNEEYVFKVGDMALSESRFKKIIDILDKIGGI